MNMKDQVCLHKMPQYLVCVSVTGVTALLCIFLIVLVGYITTSNTFQTIQHSGSGNKEKYFYLSNVTKNWTESKQFCHSQKLELANIGTEEEMEHLKNLIGNTMYWIGLKRNKGESWKWTNGTTFNDLFEISGSGFFAFLSADGIQSSNGFLDLKYICSKLIA